MINLRGYLILCLYIACNLCQAQNSQYKDSLDAVLNNSPNDTTRLRLILEMVETIPDEDLWPQYNERAFELAQKLSKDPDKQIKDLAKHALIPIYSSFGYYYQMQEDGPKSIEFYKKSVAISQELGVKKGLETSLNNIGIVYYFHGNIPMALDYYHQSLKVQESENNEDGVATSLINIGSIYQTQKDYKKALEYFERALKLAEKTHSKLSLALALNNIGTVYQEKKEVEKARIYFEKNIPIREELKDLKGLTIIYNNIGLTWLHTDLEKATQYFKKALEISQKINTKKELAYSYDNLASVYLLKNNREEAFKYACLSLANAKESGLPVAIRNAAEILREIYKFKKDYKSALEMEELFVLMRDSVNDQANRQSSVKQQMQIEFEQKQLADSLKNGEENRIKELKHQQDISHQKIYAYIGIGGFILAMIICVILWNSYRQKKRSNIQLETKNMIIEQKQKEILDSIHYAKRIQQSLLPTEKYIKKNIK